MVEHNLLAASKLYVNIGFEQLGGILGVEGWRAEGYAAGMLARGGCGGVIDQVEGWIEFKEDDGNGDGNSGSGEVRRWEGVVGGVVEDVERVASLIV